MRKIWDFGPSANSRASSNYIHPVNNEDGREYYTLVDKCKPLGASLGNEFIVHFNSILKKKRVENSNLPTKE